jgi:hypothetical protein
MESHSVIPPEESNITWLPYLVKGFPEIRRIASASLPILEIDRN